VSRRGSAGGPPVPVTFSGRGMSLTPDLRALVEGKLARLTRTLPNVLEARVVWTAEKFRRRVRITLTARRETFASEATAPQLATAVDEALEALRRQTRKAKERHTAGKARPTRRLGLREPPP
jgi:ribosome hibernation promoting factor